MIRSTLIGPYKLYAEDMDSQPESPTVDITGRRILDKGIEFEPHVYREIERLIPHAKCFLDIGANVGLYTIAAKALRSELPVVAVEVSHFNCQMLLRSIVENKLDGIRVLNVPLADKERIIQVNLNAINTGCAMFGNMPTENGLEYRYAFPLDAFDVSKCDLVKMDIDGFEHLVLQGATNLMAQRPKIIFEYCPEVTHRSGLNSPVQLLQFFVDRRYSLTVLDYIPGVRKTFLNAQECHDYMVTTTQWITDILAEPL